MVAEDLSSFIILRQTVNLDVFAEDQCCKGWTELEVRVPPQAEALLFSVAGLDVSGVLMNGQAAAFEIHASGGGELEGAGTQASLDSVRDGYLHAFQADLVGPTLALPISPTPGTQQVVAALRYRLLPEYGTVQYHGSVAVAATRGPWPGPLHPRLLDVTLLPLPDLLLHVTVPTLHVAVASGRLVRRSARGAGRRCFEYRVGAGEGQLALAAGPLPARHRRVADGEGEPEVVAHGPAALAGLLGPTCDFLALVYRCYSDKLAAAVPLGMHTQVFVPSGAIGQPRAAPGWACHPAADAVRGGAQQATTAPRLALATAAAAQVFGLALRPATPADAWLVSGLAAWLVDQFAGQYLGRNEVLYRRWRAAAATCAADDGSLPPLAARVGGSLAHALAATSPLSDIMALKAAAVVRLLERRAGDDLFRKHVQTTVALALGREAGADGTGSAPPAGEGGGVAPPPPPPPCTLDAASFVTELGRLAGFRKDVPAFLARWVYGAGVPRITAGFVYHAGPQRRSVLELALRQEGSGRAAAAAAAATAVSESAGAGVGILRVTVQEAEAAVEHPVHLGAEPWKLAELKVNPDVKRTPGRRGAKRRKAEETTREEVVPFLAALEAEENPLHPVQWVRIDPSGEWLCAVRLEQPLRCWIAQLANSRDVVAQAEAVAALGNHAAPAAVAALVRCAADEGVYHRVRADAEAALGRRAGAVGAAEGISALLAFYKKKFWDAGLDAPMPCVPRTLNERLMGEAAIRALGESRDEDGTTPIDVLLFLPAALEQFPSEAGAQDSSGMLAALCTAVGNIQHELFKDAALVLLERHLHRELVCPSPGVGVGKAVVGALAALVSAPGAWAGDEHWQRVRGLLASLAADGKALPDLRDAADAARLRLEAAARGPVAAMAGAMRALRAAHSVQAREGIAHAALRAAPALARHAGGDGDAPATAAAVPAVQRAAAEAGSPWLRHALHVLAHLLLGGPLAFQDTVDDGAGEVSEASGMARSEAAASQRFTLRLPTSMPATSAELPASSYQGDLAGSGDLDRDLGAVPQPEEAVSPLGEAEAAGAGLEQQQARDAVASPSSFKVILKL